MAFVNLPDRPALDAVRMRGAYRSEKARWAVRLPRDIFGVSAVGVRPVGMSRREGGSFEPMRPNSDASRTVVPCQQDR